MKIYNPKQEPKKKSWAIELEKCESETSLYIYIVDAEDGTFLKTMLAFYSDGAVFRPENAKPEPPYNPHEHGNKWDDEGRIVIN